MRNKCVFGYRYSEGRYLVQPEEAEVVRAIFRDYISGLSLRTIAGRVTTSGQKTCRGSDFSHSTINYIVHNELYTGTILLQKTFVRDFMTHSRAKNHGELPQYRLPGCHEAIIDEATFAKAQEESRRRAATKTVYCFSKKLICSSCGKPFTRFSNHGKYINWHCRDCGGVKLKEDKLFSLFGMGSEEISAQVDSVLVGENGRLMVTFNDGRVEECRYE